VAASTGKVKREGKMNRNPLLNGGLKKGELTSSAEPKFVTTRSVNPLKVTG
jgi:hypothetical protein